MGREDPRFLVVGHLSKPHGTKGELFVWPLTDHPESVFAPGVVLLLGGEDQNAPDPDLPPLRIEGARPFRRGMLITFGGVDDRDQAELMRGRYLFRSADELEPLAEGDVFYHQLEVTGDHGQKMIPFLEHIVVEIDADAGRLVIDPPDGLLDL
jgi:16S rRNA processing protein RimM